jgi:hypothetical protein
MLHLRLALPMALPLALAAPGCSSSPSDCVAEGTVTVQVANQAIDSENNFVCSPDETVTMQSMSGGALITLAGEGPMVSCGYTATVAPGTYTITASGTGFITATQNETIGTTGCVTNSPQITIDVMTSAQP